MRNTHSRGEDTKFVERCVFTGSRRKMRVQCSR